MRGAGGTSKSSTRRIDHCVVSLAAGKQEAVKLFVFEAVAPPKVPPALLEAAPHRIETGVSRSPGSHPLLNGHHRCCLCPPPPLFQFRCSHPPPSGSPTATATATATPGVTGSPSPTVTVSPSGVLRRVGGPGGVGGGGGGYRQLQFVTVEPRRIPTDGTWALGDGVGVVAVLPPPPPVHVHCPQH